MATAPFCTRLTHRSLFENRRFPEGELNEDFYLLVQMLPEVPGIAVLPQQDYHVFYRYGSNSRTHDENYFPPVFTDIVRNADRVSKIVEEQYPLLAQEAMRFGLFQRLDYMLHIPVTMMNSDNEFYQQVKQYLRKHKKEIRKNPYLTKKNKTYLLFARNGAEAGTQGALGITEKQDSRGELAWRKRIKRFFS